MEELIENIVKAYNGSFFGLIERPNEKSDNRDIHPSTYNNMRDVMNSRVTDSAKDKFKDKRSPSGHPNANDSAYWEKLLRNPIEWEEED